MTVENKWKAGCRSKMKHDIILTDLADFHFLLLKKNFTCKYGNSSFMKRNPIKQFLVSFIPSYVGNSVVVKVYHLLTLIPVPQRIRIKNHEHNAIWLKDARWNFLTVPSVYIENQNEWGEIRFGWGSHHNMRYSGCEIIATFNALKALGKTGSPYFMAELIDEYEKHGAALWGEFGVSPPAVCACLKRQGFSVVTAKKDDDNSLNMVDSRCRVFIATVYNDAKDITAQIHTVCITKEEGKYILHNAYRRNRKGVYMASISYATLKEAISHISGQETKMIYLIGIDSNIDQSALPCGSKNTVHRRFSTHGHILGLNSYLRLIGAVMKDLQGIFCQKP